MSELASGYRGGSTSIGRAAFIRRSSTNPSIGNPKRKRSRDGPLRPRRFRLRGEAQVGNEIETSARDHACISAPRSVASISGEWTNFKDATRRVMRLRPWRRRMAPAIGVARFGADGARGPQRSRDVEWRGNVASDRQNRAAETASSLGSDERRARCSAATATSSPGAPAPTARTPAREGAVLYRASVNSV
jgi:hypothetical protein